MKKAPLVLLCVLLALLLAGCTAPQGGSGSQTALADAIAQSYYAGQSARAYKMLQKSIFEGMLNSWTGEKFENPVWNYESFAAYEILDPDMAPVPTEGELYYCTFSADGGKQGYAVVAYDGDSLSPVSVEETPYLYDAQVRMDSIVEELGDAGLDTASLKATRVRLTDDAGATGEAIRVTDGGGQEIFCYFSESVPVCEDPAAA